uniref:Ig-like domain-containing protein n=1 Tax=Sinocyclocheilus rhinocerous TaxID=307959 RepID=A0A673GMG8_9TELE
MFNPTFWAVTQLLGQNNPIAGFVHRPILPSITLSPVVLNLVLMPDWFSVHGPSGPLVATLGSSVVLPCYVDELLSMEGLEVEWRRTDSETLVHLYQDGESRAESQQQDYHDRAHFFTDQIQHGNFSLRLDNLRAQDEGRYTCKVYSQQESAKMNLELRLLGKSTYTKLFCVCRNEFSDSHFMSCIILTFGFVCLHVCANTCKNIDAGVFLKSSCKDQTSASVMFVT